MRCLALLLAACSLTACAPDLRDDFPFDGDLPAGDYVTFEDQSDGTATVHVDATHKESWVYVNMRTRAQVSASDAVGKDTWDLAFQRYKIISNSGVSGIGTVETAILDGQSFDAVTSAPATGYLEDAEDGPDSNSDVDSPFLIGDGWYSYSLVEHKRSARPIVYVVHLADGYDKLQMLSYYDAAGTGAKLSFRWGKVAAP